ncbi:hypothetical protein HDU89_000260 [Geranomyces variabilis]|nr:hypothetical protein HDU89_000260 [Geranomyces variabilis]
MNPASVEAFLKTTAAATWDDYKARLQQVKQAAQAALRAKPSKESAKFDRLKEEIQTSITHVLGDVNKTTRTLADNWRDVSQAALSSLAPAKRSAVEDHYPSARKTARITIDDHNSGRNSTSPKNPFAKDMEAGEVAGEHSEEPGQAGVAPQDDSDGFDEEADDKAGQDALSIELLVKKFKNKKDEKSSREFLYGKANISKWTREAQHHVVRLCEGKMRVLKFQVADIADIFLLHDILLISETYLPSFIAETASNRLKIRKLWKTMGDDFRAKHMEDDISETTTTKVNKFVTVTSFGLTVLAGHDFRQTWSRHFTEGVGNPEFETFMFVIRSFHRALGKTAMLKELKVPMNEDTDVHTFLHSLVEEIFTDDRTVTVWYVGETIKQWENTVLTFLPRANGESESSKAHRAAYSKKSGKKADSRILSKAGEEVFVEAKSSKHADTASAVVYDLYKVGIFLQGAVNHRSKTAGTAAACYGFHFLRKFH